MRCLRKAESKIITRATIPRTHAHSVPQRSLIFTTTSRNRYYYEPSIAVRKLMLREVK